MSELKYEFLGFLRPQFSHEQPWILEGVIRFRYNDQFSYDQFRLSEELLFAAKYDAIECAIRRVVRQREYWIDFLERLGANPKFTDTGDGGVLVSISDE